MFRSVEKKTKMMYSRYSFELASTAIFHIDLYRYIDLRKRWFTAHNVFFKSHVNACATNIKSKAL